MNEQLTFIRGILHVKPRKGQWPNRETLFLEGRKIEFLNTITIIWQLTVSSEL
jgi:hypothetical protein